MAKTSLVPQPATNINVAAILEKANAIRQIFHRDLPPTTVFAFGSSNETATIPGPMIHAMHGVAMHITWENHLPMHHILPFDPTIPIADPKGGGIPTVVHLHGGIHPPASDGNSRAWFTSSFRLKGPSFVSPTSVYLNVQEPGNLWFLPICCDAYVSRK